MNAASCLTGYRPQRPHRVMRVLALALLCASLQGCSMLGQTWRWAFGPAQLRQVELVADDDANDDTPVAVDLVQVNDAGALATLANLKASDWFAARADWLRQYQQNVQVSSWEPTPGSRMSRQIVPIHDGARGYLVFAGYPGEGTFRARFSAVKRVLIILKKNDIEIQPG